MKLNYCNVCHSSAIRKTSNKEVYGVEYGNGMCYLCDSCGSYVGCHKDGRPLGILANKQMRLKKIKCHSLFDAVWRSGELRRSECYHILSKKMNISYRDCHFGLFGIEELNAALNVLEKDNWHIN